MPRYFEINYQDTTKTIKQIQVVQQQEGMGKLEIERKTIELSTLDRLIDSTRITPKPKKIRPVIKTVPFITENDSLSAPEYNTFTGEFEFPQQPKDWDNFYFTPFDPGTKEKPKINKPQQLLDERLTETKLISTDGPLIKESQNLEKGFAKTDWMLGVLVVVFILSGWINVKFSRFVTSVLGASYNYFAAKRLQEEGNVVRSKVFMIMNFLFFINTALVITQWFEFNHVKIFGQSGYMLFIIFLIVVIGIYSLKSLILLLLDFIFLTKGAFVEYNSTVFIYNKLYGFALLPLVTCIPFISEDIANYLLILAGIIFAILYFMRLLRGIVIGFKNRLSILYLFLYLCALEILPLLILYHLVAMYI